MRKPWFLLQRRMAETYSGYDAKEWPPDRWQTIFESDKLEVLQRQMAGEEREQLYQMWTYRICEIGKEEKTGEGEVEKTLNNTNVTEAKKNVPDLEVYGDGDTFKLICKASSKSEGWMKSTKAMEIPGVGCVVQVTTFHGGIPSEAVCFVPGVKIVHIGTLEKGKTSVTHPALRAIS